MIEETVVVMRYIHDVRIMEEALDLAVDTTAAEPARIAALLTMLWTKAPGHRLSVHDMVVAPTCVPPACASTATMHFYNGGPFAGGDKWPVIGVAPVEGYVARIDSVAAWVADRSRSLAVLAAARTVILFG
jgi:hypothetical protein